MKPEGRVLAMDYGTKRIGLAVTDLLKITVLPLKFLLNRGTTVWVRELGKMWQ